MRPYNVDTLLIRPENGKNGLLLEVTPERAGWQFLSFEARRLDPGGRWAGKTSACEMGLVNLSGRYRVQSSRGEWRVGGRENVFTGPGEVLYLPRDTEFSVTAEAGGEFAAAWAPATRDGAPLLIRADTVPISVRGGDHATRQINDLLPPGAPVERLVLVEVYTPGGNWSSYPPHKHDVHEERAGALVEADLEEIYFYKFEPRDGYALQWIYTGDDSPLQRAGAPIDTVIRPEENCAVLVPEGYHPVSSPPGYMTYYLNVLAGSAQSLANRDDPKYAWIKDSYRTVDPRVPIYGR